MPLVSEPQSPPIAPVAGSSPVGDDRSFAAPGLWSSWREIWHRRQLLWEFIGRDVRLRYHQAVMGFLWALLMPCLVLGASVVVRALMQRGSAPTVPMGSLAVKAWGWAFFVGSINFATTSLLSNMNLVAKIYFPREVLPMSAVGAQAVDSTIGLAFLALLSPILGIRYSFALLWIVPLALLLALMTVGLSLFLAAANVFYRDVKYLVQVGVTFGIFVSPVFYSVADLGPRGRLLVLLNPLSPLLEGLGLVVRGQGLMHTLPAPDGGIPFWSPLWLLGSAAVGVLLLLASGAFFRSRADQFAELA
jgi:ABC-type polysaccharide/polyol phosphate export permease